MYTTREWIPVKTDEFKKTEDGYVRPKFINNSKYWFLFNCQFCNQECRVRINIVDFNKNRKENMAKTINQHYQEFHPKENSMKAFW